MNPILSTDAKSRCLLLSNPVRSKAMEDVELSIRNIPESEVLYHADWNIYVGLTSETKLNYYWASKGMYDKKQKALIPVHHETKLYYIRQLSGN